MFGFKKNKDFPPFHSLAASPLKNTYIIRTCEWRWLEKGKIVVNDKNQPRVITLDPWPQLVFLEAKGNKTISQIIHRLAKMYTSAIPEELDVTFLQEVDTLVKERLIELKEEPCTIDKSLLYPLP